MKKRKEPKLRVAFHAGGPLSQIMESFQGFQSVAVPLGWQVMLLGEAFELELRALTRGGRVDAVVGDFISERWISSLPGRPLAVQLGRTALSATLPSVCLDTRTLGERAGQHLRENGYTRLLYVSPNPDAELRQGLRQSDRELQVVRGIEALTSVFQSAGGPIGVFCENDAEARFAIRRARALGLRLPEEAGFLGVGDQVLDRGLAEMEISSFRLPVRAMGAEAARQLRSLALTGQIAHVRFAPEQLIPRLSTRRSHRAEPLRTAAESQWLDRLADPLPVSELARQAGQSRRAYERAFAAECGCTPYAHLIQLRLREARRLMRETDRTLAAIGAEIGIPDPPRFSAFFKHHCGITASAWRLLPPAQAGNSGSLS